LVLVMSTERPITATERPITDWEAVEKDYRAGIATLRQIAETHGTTHTTVANRAKAGGWDRDLGAKIASKAEAILSKSHLSSDLSKPATERQIVESNAQVVAAVAIAEQASIKRHRSLTEKLLDELEAQCDNPALFAQLAELMRSPEDRGTDKLNDLYRKVIGLPSRIDGAKKLAETLRILVSLEREAYGMDKDDQSGEDQIKAIVRRIIG
jgi:hypothetical protein